MPMIKNRTERWEINLSFLEQGNIYFFYKPKKGNLIVERFDEVGRFYFVLQPFESTQLRFIVLGAKKLPKTQESDGAAGWAIVQRVGGKGFEVERQQTMKSGSARPAGEGVYALVRHDDHTHFLYSLELPSRLGEVQHALGISREANYIIVIKHPITTSPTRTTPPYVISDQKFRALESSHELNQTGSEILLTSGKKLINRLGVRVEKDHETMETADIFSKLHVDQQRHPITPLVSGKWI